jgi:hypothetical protein
VKPKTQCVANVLLQEEFPSGSEAENAKAGVYVEGHHPIASNTKVEMKLRDTIHLNCSATRLPPAPSR